MNLTLREKFEACIAGAQIGAAMGAVTKGMTWQTIQEKYDFVDTFFDYTAADQYPAGPVHRGMTRNARN